MDWILYLAIAAAVGIICGVVIAYYVDTKRLRKKRSSKEILHIELNCPHCQHKITFDAPARVLPRAIICPQCRERIDVNVR